MKAPVKEFKVPTAIEVEGIIDAIRKRGPKLELETNDMNDITNKIEKLYKNDAKMH